MDYLIGCGLIGVGYYFLLKTLNKQNKEISRITDTLFYYDQQYKELLDLNHRLSIIEYQLKKIDK